MPDTITRLLKQTNKSLSFWKLLVYNNPVTSEQGWQTGEMKMEQTQTIEFRKTVYGGKGLEPGDTIKIDGKRCRVLAAQLVVPINEDNDNFDEVWAGQAEVLPEKTDAEKIQYFMDNLGLYIASLKCVERCNLPDGAVKIAHKGHSFDPNEYISVWTDRTHVYRRLLTPDGHESVRRVVVTDDQLPWFKAAIDLALELPELPGGHWSKGN